jgi:hypothetical protein
MPRFIASGSNYPTLNGAFGPTYPGYQFLYPVTIIIGKIRWVFVSVVNIANKQPVKTSVGVNMVSVGFANAYILPTIIPKPIRAMFLTVRLLSMLHLISFFNY